MELTCNFPMTKPNEPDDMEFTCNLPILKPKDPEDMELTCKHPILKPEEPEDMELTCKLPILKPLTEPNVIQRSKANEPDDMEFTGNFPTLRPNEPDDMEFTCNLPILKPNFSEEGELTFDDRHLKSSSPVEMDITCKTNLLRSSSPREMDMTCKTNLTKSDNLEKRELTCSDLHLESNSPGELDMTCTTKDSPGEMDMTCTTNITKSDILEKKEITCGDLHHESSSPVEMDMTCKTNITKSNILEKGDLTCGDLHLESSSPMEMDMTCKTNITKSSILEKRGPPLGDLHIESDSPMEMDMTCKTKITMSNIPDKRELTCGDIQLVSNLHLESNSPREMDKMCETNITKSSILDRRELACDHLHHESNSRREMDTTCETNIEKSNILDKRELTCGDLPLGSNSSREMDKTCETNITKSSISDRRELVCGDLHLESNSHKEMDKTYETNIMKSSNLDRRELVCGDLHLESNSHREMDKTCETNITISSISDRKELACGDLHLESNSPREMYKTCETNIMKSNILATRELACDDLHLESNSPRQMDKTYETSIMKSNISNRRELTCADLHLESNSPREMDKTCETSTTKSNTLNEKELASDDLHLESNSPMDMCGSSISKSNPDKMEHTRDDFDKSNNKENDISVSKCIVEPSIANSTVSCIESNFGKHPFLDQTKISNISEISVSAGLSFIHNKTVGLANDSVLVLKQNEQVVDLPHLSVMLSPEKTLLTEDIQPPQMSCEYMDIDNTIADTSNKQNSSNAFKGNRSSLDFGTRIGNDTDTATNISYFLDKKNLNSSSISFCVDDTQQLINAANKINKTRNLTCDESTIESVSRPQNLTYLVKESQTETGNNMVGETEEVIPEKIDNKPEKYVDVFIKCRDEEDINMIDQEVIENLIENSCDENSCNFSMAGHSNRSASENHMDVENGTEVVSLENSSDGNKVIAISKGGSSVDQLKKPHVYVPVDFAGLMAKKRERLQKFQEKIDSITFKEPEVRGRLNLECHKKYLMEKKAEDARKKKQWDDGIARLIQYQNSVLEILSKRATAPAVLDEENESISDSGDIEEMPPSLVKQIEEKEKMCDNCWNIVKIEDCIADFTTLHGKLEFSLEYNPVDYSVRNLTTKSALSDKAKPIAYLMQKELLRSLTPDNLNNSIGHHYNILTLLDYVQMSMLKIRKMYGELKELELSHDLVVTSDYRVTFKFLNQPLVIKWVFTIDLSDLEKITKDCISVNAVIGTVNVQHVLDLAAACSKGVEFIMLYVNKIEEYLQILMKKKQNIP